LLLALAPLAAAELQAAPHQLLLALAPLAARLVHDQERALVQRKMAKEEAEHESFEQEQAELRAAAQGELERKGVKDTAEVTHLERLRSTLSLSGQDMAGLLVARANGPAAKLIQIAEGVGVVQLQADA
ncbi:hypothetical protein T492DRAFT_862616, partial [Pavlovales sp. CCMP2436]